MARDEHGKTLTAKFAGTATPAGNADLQGFPFSEGWDENYWPPGTSTISGPVVNAVLRIISAVGKEINEYGILEWDVGLTYQQHAIVLGSDGALYQSQQASNVGIDPTGDTDDSHWALITDRYLASQTEAATGTDTEKLMTPARVRNTISALIADVTQAQTDNNNVNLMTPQRVRNLITHILATAAQARDGIENDVLMTPQRVQDAIDANPPSVSRHDSPVITLDAATGSVVDTTSALGTNAVARVFEPLLVAARARGGYSIGNEVIPLGGSVPATVRKVNDRSFAVHAAAGDVDVPFPVNPNGIYLFRDRRAFYLPAAAGWNSPQNLGNVEGVTSINAGTYYVNNNDMRVFAVDDADLYEISNPRIPQSTRSLGRILNTAILDETSGVAAMAAHNGTLWCIGFHGGTGVGSGNYTGFRLARIDPNNPSSTSSGYGYVSGGSVLGRFLPERVPVGRWIAMTSHDNALYAVRYTATGHIIKLYRINTTTPASSAEIGTFPSPGANIDATLFSFSDTLYCWIGNRLYSVATSPFSATLIGTYSGYHGAAVVTDYPTSYEASLGNTGDTTADFNLKIRYSA